MRTIALHPILPKASQLAFGCASLGSRYDRRQSLRALAIAFDHGVNVFDTARSYGYGEAEGILGEFVRGRRERVIVASKAGIRAPQRVPKAPLLRSLARRVFAFAPSLRSQLERPLARQHARGQFEPSELRASIEHSLRELRTDRLDVFFLHDVPAEQARREDVLALLDALRVEGKLILAGPSASREVLTELAASEPALGRAIQFPSSAARWPTFPRDFVRLVRGMDAAARVRFGNRPFDGGAPLDPTLEARIRAVGPLREALLRLPLSAGLCDVVVTAMLNPEHIVQNCRALSDCTIPHAALASLADSLLHAEEPGK